MASINEKLNYINETKSLIKDKLNDLGSEIDNETTFRKYAEKIEILYEEWPKISDEDTTINLENTKKGKMILQLKGNTTQDETPTLEAPIPVNVVSGDNEIMVCGKNFIGMEGITFPFTQNGITVTRESDGSYTFNGTITANTNFNLTPYSNAETYKILKQCNDKTITLSYTSTGTGKIRNYGIKRPDGFDVFITSDQVRTGYFPIVNYTDLTFCIRLGVGDVENNQFINYNIKPQLELGSTLTEYEKFNGNAYEVNLKRYVPVGYTQVDYIENSGTQFIDTGFKPNQNTSVEMEVLIPQNSAEVTRFFETRNYNYVYKTFGLLNFRDTNNQFQLRYDAQFSKTNYHLDTETKYKIKIDKNKAYVNDELMITAIYTNLQTNYNLALFGFANNRDNVADTSTYRLYSFKLYDNGVLIRDYVPCYRNSDNEVGLYDFVNKVFYTNSGTGIFTYGNIIPNNSIELCKIENYQDRIYKNNGKWYLEKKIGKKVLNGSEENWENYYGASLFSINKGLNSTPFVTGYGLSNYYKYNSVQSGINANTSNGEFALQKTIFPDYNIFIKNTNYTSVEDFKTWLSTHNTTIYYVLETPTTTEITDTELINQLNALESARSFDTTTNITQNTNNLPFILNVNALKKNSSN